MTQAMSLRSERRALLAASLFSIDGKLPVSLIQLTDDGATVMIDAPPPVNSIAIVVRNGVRVFCAVAAVDGLRVELRFDDPLRGWRMEDFAGPALGTREPMLEGGFAR